MKSYTILIKTIKLHRPLYNGICVCLEHIFMDGYHADKVIERVFRQNKQWGSKDRALIAETVYDMVRHWRLLNSVCGFNYTEINPERFDVLMQACFLFIQHKTFAFEWQHKINEAEATKLYQTLQSEPAVACSVPDWMYEKGKSELGTQWDKELAALNETAPIVLRLNTLKAPPGDVEKQLKAHDIAFVHSTLVSNALILAQRMNIFSTPFFKEGWIEVQDEGSQVIGEFCGVKPGMRVVDACAGAGGKSLQLASLMGNKGKIISMDIEAQKLEELKKRARRAGAFNIETRVIEGSKTIKKLEESADVVLLDVPCSGTGVLRRNPDAKWKLKPAFMNEIARTQQEILLEYSKMVKVGGVLVYSTCSVFPSENGEQVKKFLASQPSFELLEEKTLSPFTHHTDGFYMAKMKRNRIV